MEDNVTKVIQCPITQNKILTSSHARIHLVVAIAITIACVVVVIFVNMLFIVATKINKSIRRSVNNLYILLSVSDLFLGLTFLPINAVLLPGYYSEILNCNVLQLRSVSSHIFATTSISVIACITAEIYLAVHQPLNHAARIRKNRMCRVLVSIWIVCISFALIANYGYDKLYEAYKLLQLFMASLC